MFTLYTKPQCVQCDATKRALSKAGLIEGADYRAVDVSQNAEALQEIKDAGFLQAPVVITDTDAWSGFRPDRIADLVAELEEKEAAEREEAYEAEMRRLANGGHDVLTDGAP